MGMSGSLSPLPSPISPLPYNLLRTGLGVPYGVTPICSETMSSSHQSFFLLSRMPVNLRWLWSSQSMRMMRAVSGYRFGTLRGAPYGLVAPHTDYPFLSTRIPPLFARGHIWSLRMRGEHPDSL